MICIEKHAHAIIATWHTERAKISVITVNTFAGLELIAAFVS